MAKIVWLASYPRSGNTWLRFLLSGLLKGSQVLNSAEVAGRVPDIHDGIRGDLLFGSRTIVIKTHWAFNSALPLREDVVGVIHLVRNPLDVLESNQNYAMTRSGNLFAQATEDERASRAREFADAYILNGGHPRFSEFGFGSWEEHTLSWASKSNAMPKLLVKYEDLLAEPESQLRRISRFIRLEKSDAEIGAAVSASTLEAMRQIERDEIARQIEGIFYQSGNAAAYAAGQRFIGGQTRRFSMTPDQRQRALGRFGSIMRQLNYEVSVASPLH
ncbi:MAG TPA: sulfotransferase domain-containing protein [Terriglobia bacterium]|nr:sulfotransferase domain-containing protein [Terriglobia bacterium]